MVLPRALMRMAQSSASLPSQALKGCRTCSRSDDGETCTLTVLRSFGGAW